MAGDDSKRPRPPAPPPPPAGTGPGKPASPFADESVDWDSELAAWDAAMPIAEEARGARNGQPPPPPDAESVEFVPEDISSQEIIIPIAPQTFEPFPDDEAEARSEVTVSEARAPESTPGPELAAPAPEPRPEAEDMDLLDLGSFDEDTPASEPRAAQPTEIVAHDSSSSILLIPDVEELVARAGTPAEGRPMRAPEPPPATSTTPTPITAPPFAGGRTLTADGLPELSGLFTAEQLLGSDEPVLDVSEATPPPVHLDPFEAEPPPDVTVTLDLDLPAELPRFAPEQVAALASLPEQGPARDADRRYWRDQLAFWTDELAVRRAQPGPPHAHAALAAGRAAELAGQHEAAHRLYGEALVAEPGWLPARRGQLRTATTPAEASEALAALASQIDEDRAAYEALAFELDLARGEHAAAPAPGAEPDAGRDLSLAEHAFARGAHDEAADALARAGRALGSSVGASLLVQAARLRELQGDLEATHALRAEGHLLDVTEPGIAFGNLRRATTLPAALALPLLEETAGALPPSPLAAAVLRWAARVARGLGRPGEERALLTRAARLLGDARLPERDRLELASADDDATLESLGLERRVLLSLRRAHARRAAGSETSALEALRVGLGHHPTAVPLALAAEELGAGCAEPRLRAEAWGVWAEGDPARRALGHWLRARALTEAGEALAAREAMRAAAEAAPGDPAFWELAWQALSAKDPARAADAFAAGAAAFRAAGATELADALDERAAELRRAVRPGDAVIASPAMASTGPAADDPAALVTRMLEPDAQPAAIAALLRDSAPADGVHRAMEAAGWMQQAGQGREALLWLLERRPTPVPADLALLLRRQARLHGDAALRARVLGDLAAASDDGDRAVLAFQRAEALEAIGERAQAAQIYRDLLAGPFAADADVGLRRTLWGLRDGAALDAMARDEADAYAGAGDGARAAAAHLERARVQIELLHDDERGLEAVRAAHGAAPEDAEPRAALLVRAARRGAFAEVVGLLEQAALRELRASGPSLLAFAALLDEGRAAGAESVRLVEAARGAAGPDVPLAVLLRRVASLLASKADGDEAADALEALARAVAAAPSADPRTVATLLVRAGEIHDARGDAERAETLLREAVVREPEWLPALVRLRRLLVRRGQWREAAQICETEAAAARVPQHQIAAYLLAARIIAEKVDDRARAAALLRKVLEVEPTHREAFDRLRAVLDAQGDGRALADLLAARLKGQLPPDDGAALRLERAALLEERLSDRAAAKEELRALLAEQPQHVEGLSRLANLELQDGAFAIAAELYIRQARFDRDPDRLRELFMRIGRIYLRRLPDAKLATGAFERVLRLDAQNREALEALSELYTKQGDNRRALGVTEPIIEAEPDAQKRMPLLLRMATLWEKSGDPRRAAACLKRAAEECPRSLQAVGELARFYERTRETLPRNVLLDGSLALLREDLRNDPANLETLRTAIPLLRWRQRPACSQAVAQVLLLLTDDPAERAELAAWAAPREQGRRLTPLANPELDELSLPAALPPGVRQVMHVAGPALQKSAKPNLKRWEVGRAERLGPGAGARAVGDSVAIDLGVRGFEVYVSAARPRALVVEPGDPPVIVIGREIAALPPAALRFAFGYALRLAATHFDLLAQGSPADTGALLAGIVRQASPDFRHPDLPEADLAAAATRVAKALPKSLRNELAPFAAEIAAPFDVQRVHVAVQETAARVGLLASGDVAAALQALALVHERSPSVDLLGVVPLAAALVDFVLSEEHEKLVAALDAVS